MNPIHPFRYHIPSGFTIDDIIPATLKFQDFIENLKKISFYYEEGEQEDFVQSGTQSFVEAIVNFHNLIDNYEPVNSVEHREQVHGVGMIDGEKTTAFIAFNGNTFITDGNSQITEYLAQSYRNHDVYGSYNIFTDNQGIHEKTVENFLSNHTPNVYNIDAIKDMVDDNDDFWAAYKASLYVDEPQETPAIELYPRQDEVKYKLLEYSAGNFRVIWPTGTGKFEIIMEHSIGHMQKLLGNGVKTPVCMTVSPRLLLIKQCIEKQIKRVNQFGIKNCKFINFTSEDFDTDKLVKENYKHVKGVLTTTSVAKLKREIKHHKGPIFIFTTYHSVEKIIEGGIYVDLMNCDEAHNIVKGRSIPKEARHSCIYSDSDQIPFKVFYTATQALSGTPENPDEDGFGMDNVELFGEAISQISPREMINDGKIVRPFVVHTNVEEATLTKHGLDFRTATQRDITHNAELNAHIACKSFEEVEKKNKVHSLDHNKNAIKLLVRCSGGITFKGILKSKELAEFKKRRTDVFIGAISSDHGTIIGGTLINGYNTKSVFIQEISELPNDVPAIIFHIDMIGEGLDIPGINAVLPFGDLNEIAANQHVGRAMRLHKLDRIRLDDGLITPEDWCVWKDGKITKGQFYKPICYIVLPIYSNRYADDINAKGIREMVFQIIENLEYYPYEQFYEATYDGSVENIPKEIKDVEYYAEDIRLEFDEPMSFEQMMLFDINQQRREEMRRKEVQKERENFRLGFEKFKKNRE